MKSSILDHAKGQWPSILGALAGLSSTQLSDKHQPCPMCGGKDRYRFDDQDGTGSWFCSKCGGPSETGGGGSGMELLIRRTGWSFAEAAKRIEQHLGIAPKRPEPALAKWDQHWRYSDTFYVVRRNLPDGSKDIRPLSWDGSRWQLKAPPAPRPLLNIDQIRTNTGTILIVEGEKTADAAARLFPKAIVTTWPSGCKAFTKADWSPLQGRRVILWPDADEPGQQAMELLAQLLLQLPVDRVQVVTPPADAPEGWDLADATWTPSEAAAYIKANLSEPIQATTLLAPLEPEPEPEADDLDPNTYYTCLGFDGDAYYYQPHSTGQVLRLARSAHTSTNLVALAPLTYWQELCAAERGGINWTSAAATLFAINADRGVYNPDRIRGRGAWWDKNRTILHLGDRLVIDGKSQPVLKPFDSRYIYQRMAELQGPSNATPLTDSESYVIWEIANRFNWEVPASGLLLAGWVTLAPICGALPWRPHAWLTAAAGSGKSAILDRYVAPLLADMGLIVAGNTTEAGLRQTLRCDALPIVFDEAESNEKSDQVRMQNILALARVASSESHATMIKGSPGGDVTRFNIRSMFLMSSIATALKQGADRSRFAQLTLRSPTELPKEQRIAHWEALDHDLDRHITSQVALRLIARTVSLIPTIRESIRVFTRVSAQHFDSQRLGDQYGTLLAGAWSLMSSNVPSDDDARLLIQQNDWEPYSQATEVPDEQRCIQRILQHQVRVEADGKTLTRTIGELVDIGIHHATDYSIPAPQARDTLERYGLRVDHENNPPLLVVSNTAEAIASILRDTQWTHSWSTLLSRLKGASKVGPTRFRGAGTLSRAVALQIRDL